MLLLLLITLNDRRDTFGKKKARGRREKRGVGEQKKRKYNRFNEAAAVGFRFVVVGWLAVLFDTPKQGHAVLFKESEKERA